MTEKDDLVKRLKDETGISQKTCSDCVKGFENHEYGCMSGEQCLDSVAVLKKTRRRLWKNSQEAATRITELERQLAEARELLRPFADEAKNWSPEQFDSFVPLSAQYTVGDLRRAARALSGKGE